MKKSTKGIVIGVITFGLLTTGAIGVYKYNKEEQKKEIKAEIKEYEKEHKKEQAIYNMYVAEYKFIKAKIDIGEADNSELEKVENKKVEQDNKMVKRYKEIEELKKLLKE